MKTLIGLRGSESEIPVRESYPTIKMRLLDSRLFLEVTLPEKRKLLLNKTDVVTTRTPTESESKRLMQSTPKKKSSKK